MVIDIILLIVLLFGFVVGFKRGFIRQLISSLGIVFILVLSFLLKKPLSIFLYNHLPFFNFGKLGALNILFYEVLSFVLIFSVLSILLKILVMVSNIFESILKMTIFLGIPSKILGGVLGIIESYIITFVMLYFISLPVFHLNVKDSNLSNLMLNNTPILSNVCGDTLKVFDDISKLKDKHAGSSSLDDINNEALNLFIKYGIISEENVQKLIEKGKI